VRRGVTARGLGAIRSRFPRQGRSCGTQASIKARVKTWTDDLSTFTIAWFAGKKKRVFVQLAIVPVGKSDARCGDFGPLSPSHPQPAVEKCAWEDSNPRPTAYKAEGRLAETVVAKPFRRARLTASTVFRPCAGARRWTLRPSQEREHPEPPGVPGRPASAIRSPLAHRSSHSGCVRSASSLAEPCRVRVPGRMRRTPQRVDRVPQRRSYVRSVGSRACTCIGWEE
jgi:hypothetical protein